MTTAGEIVSAALSDLLYTGVGETATGPDLATGLRMLNDMLFSWANESVDVLHEEFTLSSLFTFFVPPKEIDGDTLAAQTNLGSWNASTNTPTLASSSGTNGDTYQVSVAGTTSLDGLATWSVGDFLVFDGTVWRKSRTTAQHKQGVTAMLVLRLSSAFSVPAPPETVAVAMRGWSALAAQFVLPTTTVFDSALTRMPSQRKFAV
jgi:hypothetical protein